MPKSASLRATRQTFSQFEFALRLRLHQIRRQRLGAGIGVAHQAEVGGLPRIGRLGGGKVGCDLRRGQMLVPEHRQDRELVAARRPPPGGMTAAASQPSMEAHSPIVAISLKRAAAVHRRKDCS